MDEKIKEIEERLRLAELCPHGLTFLLHAVDDFHALIYRIKELEELAIKQDELLDVASTRINKTEERVKELEEGIEEIPLEIGKLSKEDQERLSMYGATMVKEAK